MRKAVGFPSGSIGCQREDRALSDEVRRGVVLVQLREDWERAPRASAAPVRAWDPWRSCTPRDGCLR
jgi:hypothetical protein